MVFFVKKKKSCVVKGGSGFLSFFRKKKDSNECSKTSEVACPLAKSTTSAVEPVIEDSAAEHLIPAVRERALGLPSQQKVSLSDLKLKEAIKLFDLSGTGIVTSTGEVPEHVSHILEAGVDLMKYAQGSKAHRHNCLILATCVKQAIQTMDRCGSAVTELEPEQQKDMVLAFQNAAIFIKDASAEGWAIQMALQPGKLESFVQTHSAIVECLQGCLPANSCRPFHCGDYRDVARPFKRFLKVNGSGSIPNGLKRIQHDEKALNEAARLLDVGAKDLLYDIQACNLEAAAASAGGIRGILYDGPLRDRECVSVFNAYVAEGGPFIDESGFCLLLEDIGILPTNDEQYAKRLFSQADICNRGRLSFSDFSTFYLAQPLSLHRQHLRAELGIKAERKLQKIFQDFASFGTGSIKAIDSFRFCKLCKDSGLIGPTLTAQQVDIIFAQAKPREQRKLDFDGMVAALALVSKHMSSSLEAVVQKVLVVGGPVAHATLADYVKFHDDKSTYTGVYARGGMSVVDQTNDPAAAMVSRTSSQSSPALHLNIRRSISALATPISSAGNTPTAAAACATPPSSHSMQLSFGKLNLARVQQLAGTPRSDSARQKQLGPLGSGRTKAVSTPRSGSRPATHDPVQSHPVTPAAFKPAEGEYMLNITPAPREVYDKDLQRVFGQYAVFGMGNSGCDAEIDGSRFAKLCRESGICTKSLDATRVDLIFARIANKARKIDFPAFEKAVQLLAEARQCSVLQIKRAIAASGGPQCKGTTPDQLRHKTAS